tara:strand:- start:1391 stop:1591 length:201 start_codon:yes stop_codon:yes gene_type:complete
MPTLDDAPTIEALLGATGSSALTIGDSDDANKLARGDILQVYDVSEQKAKTVTVQALGESMGITFA